MNKRRGFTLIEMLVVIGIILVLIGILLPAVNKSFKASTRIKMAADLSEISRGLEQYKNDFGDYPRPAIANRGAVILCWALVAPGPESQDGYNGNGFRLRKPPTGAQAQGQVYGPYISDNLKISVPDDTTATILDRYSNPILYFPRNLAAPPPTTAAKYVGTANNWPPKSTDPVYNQNDGTNISVANMLKQMPGGNPFKAGETVNQPYILWSAGPDGLYGAAFGGAVSDDVTNLP